MFRSNDLRAEADDVHEHLWPDVLTRAPARVRSLLVDPLRGEEQIGTAWRTVLHLLSKRTTFGN